MKIKILTMGLAVGLTASLALAAINPLAPGLPGQLNAPAAPATWAVTAGRGYDAAATALAGNPASAMCVECHYTNPSVRAMGLTGTGDVFEGGTTYNVDRATMTGSHTVMASVGFTNSGGGFLGGASAGPRTGREYMKATTWSTGAYSKYGSGAAYATVTAPGSGDPDLICESCHNVLINSGNQLLVGTYDNQLDDTMCVNCHAAAATTQDYAGFHQNGNLPAFGSSAAQAAITGLVGRKKHHVLNKNTTAGWRDMVNTAAAGPYNPDSLATTSDSVMWAPSYTKELGTGAYNGWTYDSTVAEGSEYKFRNLVNVTGTGTLAQALAAGDIPTDGNATTPANSLLCVSCHRPHNAETSAGAFIFRNGTGSVVAPIYSAVTADGLTRQADVGNYTGTKVYGEYKNLCNGCHAGYGN